MASPGKARGAVIAALLLTGLALPLPAAAADAPVDTPAATTPIEPDPAPPSKTTSYLAAIVAPTTVHRGPSDASKTTGRVKPTTPWGGSTQLLIRRSQRTGGELWIDVKLMGRPNGHHGWVKADHAVISQTPWRIEVRRSAKRLQLFNAGQLSTTLRVVVGKRSTPTPAGRFALVDKLHLKPATGFLGNWALPITAYSNVLTDFDGGSGQVALHGRGGASLNDPLGTAASHGCVRISNAAIGAIAAKVPTGTPVNIS